MQIELSSGTRAFIERPAARTSDLGVVLGTDIFGLRPAFEDLAGRLAREHGWTVAAVDSLPGHAGEGMEERLSALPGLDDDRQLGDLDLAAKEAGCKRTALVGFCMGGAFALKARPRGGFERIVSFYGMVHPAWAGDQQADPLERAAAAPQVPLLAIVGERDEFIPAEHVAELERASVTVLRYAGAGHAFAHDPDSGGFMGEAADDAWVRACRFLHDEEVRAGRWDPTDGFVAVRPGERQPQ
jgi:dienelactone hydrolase